MDIKTLLNNLHEEVSCSVCMTTFTDPKQLPCLHSFCFHCLNGILRTSGRHDIITCPECRRESKVPSSGNLRDLPTNFRINSLLDVLAITECHYTGVKCGNCDKRTAQSFYCFQCCAFWQGRSQDFSKGGSHWVIHRVLTRLSPEYCRLFVYKNSLQRGGHGHPRTPPGYALAFWCDDCVTGHNIIRANKEHRVLALTDFQDQDIEDVLKRPAFCPTLGHEKKELEFFCKICEVAICNACALTDREAAGFFCRSQVTGHRSQVTGHRSQVTGHRIAT